MTRPISCGPTDINGINKAAGEYYHLVYDNVFGVRACSLRLTNVYGPRQLIKHNRQGFIGWFIRLAVEGKEIQIYGDGSQLRDFVFVDDVVEAFLRAGATDAVNGDVFNVGGMEPISHRDLVELLIGTAGSGSVRYVEWPPEKKAIDIGSFYSDSTKFRNAVGWRPEVTAARRAAPDGRVLPASTCRSISRTDRERGRGASAEAEPMPMVLQLAALLVVAWLPGAALYRAPVFDRARRGVARRRRAAVLADHPQHRERADHCAVAGVHRSLPLRIPSSPDSCLLALLPAALLALDV